MFSKGFFFSDVKSGDCVERVNYKILELSKFMHQQNAMKKCEFKENNFVLGRVENIVGKGENVVNCIALGQVPCT